MMVRTLYVPCLALGSFFVSQSSGTAGDLPLRSSVQEQLPKVAIRPMRSFSGRASVIDGRTLWFPKLGVRLTLAGLDTCELPQWAFDPTAAISTGRRLKPVACGALAKAWLKRVLQDGNVKCRVEDARLPLTGWCSVNGRDLGLELIMAGWARLTKDAASTNPYRAAETQAVAARYGIWGTYVLDMDEWRASAVDRTPDRRPIADYNLIRDRRLEISPPFSDARQLPKRLDR